MAEGTQLRGPRLDRLAEVDRRIEAVHDERETPAQALVLCPGAEQLEVASMLPFASTKNINPIVRVRILWLRAKTRIGSLYTGLTL